mgnify:CR=1 FL=1
MVHARKQLAGDFKFLAVPLGIPVLVDHAEVRQQRVLGRELGPADEAILVRIQLGELGVIGLFGIGGLGRCVVGMLVSHGMGSGSKRCEQ